MRRIARRFAATILLLGVLILCTGISYGDEKVLYSWHPNEAKKIALTFDDGPHPVYTREILDILQEYQIHATFFVVGENATWYPELVSEEIAYGNEVGNHTYSHANLCHADAGTVIREIMKTENAVYENTEFRCHLLRPPGGLYGQSVCEAAKKLDYSVILWSVDTRDWAHTPTEQIVENVMTNIKSGDIILFHDYIGGAPSPTPEALRKIIPALLADGYQFVTVSELLGSE